MNITPDAIKERIEEADNYEDVEQFKAQVNHFINNNACLEHMLVCVLQNRQNPSESLLLIGDCSEDYTLLGPMDLLLDLYNGYMEILHRERDETSVN